MFPLITSKEWIDKQISLGNLLPLDGRVIDKHKYKVLYMRLGWPPNGINTGDDCDDDITDAYNYAVSNIGENSFKIHVPDHPSNRKLAFLL